MFEAFDIMLMLGGGCLSVNMSLGYGQEGGLGSCSDEQVKYSYRMYFC